MLDKNGNEMTDLNINISPRTANHQADRLALNKGQNTTKFSSMTDLEEKAEKIFTREEKQRAEEMASDIENGFDINDIESVKKFDIGYTPLGQTIIVKNLFEKEKIGGLLLVDQSSKGNKAVVINTGLYSPTLRVGDIVVLKPIDTSGQIHQTIRTFNKVKFSEIETVFVAGVFQTSQIITERLEEDAKRYNQLKNGI